MKAAVRKFSKSKYGSWLKKLFVLSFFVLVAVLIFNRLRELSWSSVWEALRNLKAVELALALALSFAGHAVYSSYDLLARSHLKHSLSRRLSWIIAHVSYAFNLNLGALIGGVGFRFRLYSRFGLKTSIISQILAFSVLTNWLGYILLLGLLLVFQNFDLPAEWGVSSKWLKLIGWICLSLIPLYLGISAFPRKRLWKIRSVELSLPSVKMAMLQLLVSSASWGVIVLLIYLLLGQAYAFPLVGFVILVAAVAGAITHVPAGLGVLEYVFLTLLTGAMSSEKLLAYLLVYRFVYYLIPLAVAAVNLAVLEMRARQRS